MTPWDWALLIAYFIFIAGIGTWAGRGQKDSSDFLLGGRSIPWGAALLSLVATEISAATFLGAPEQGYLRNLTYLQFGLGSIAARFFLASYFIGVYYRAGVTTVYEFLAQRFGKGTQRTTAGLFLFGRLFADGARLFIAAITIEVVTGFPIGLSILLLTVITMAYTTAGGIKAVIWTDVVQAVILVGSGIALLVSLIRDAGLSMAEAYQQLSAANKLTLFETSSSPWTDPYNMLTAMIGGFVLTLATHGTDHDMVQRLLTCKDDAGSRRSTWLSGLVGIAITILFISIGFFLYLHLKTLPAGSELAAQAAALGEDGRNGHYLLYYALSSLPAGVVGLLVAGILSAAMSSLSSAFNAMTATFISDFYRPFRPGLTGEDELKASRLATVVIGSAVTAVALLVADFYKRNPETDLLSLALGVMTFFYGGLLGIFLVALFTRSRGSDASNMAAAAIGTGVVFMLPQLTDLAWPWYVVVGTVVSVAVSVCGQTRM